MRLLHQLTEKPWLAAGDPVVGPRAGRSFLLPTATLGLRMLLAVVAVLFFLLIIAYAERMAAEEWRPSPQPWLMWLNTALLITSSVAMQWAWIGIRRERMDDAALGLIAGGAFAVAFLGGQVLAWRQLGMVPAFDVTNPAIAFFYLITALHGLHLLGGLVAWGRTTARLWRGFDAARLRLSVELCAVYWHFLLAVWLVLFGLLFSGNNNLDILLAICGLR